METVYNEGGVATSTLVEPGPRGYRVRILTDSVGPNRVRLTTWLLRYPRFVHAELLTHRLFSKNSASSRAIPTKKLMEQIRREPAVPVFWGKNQAGMQSREQLTGWRLALVKRLWLSARWGALLMAWLMTKVGFHKQIANRILEPWMFIEVILTATEFDNWFRLRCHPDAQPEIGWVAKEMKRQYDSTLPRCLVAGEWHLPLIDFDDEVLAEPIGNTGQALVDGKADNKALCEYLCKVSAGRCARVSYLTHEGKRDMEEDVTLANRLSKAGHWSPFEHVAQAMPKNKCRHQDHDIPSCSTTRIWSGNLRGWTQYRATIDPTFTVVGR